MKRIFLIFMFAQLYSFIYAQNNLVKNPSFEEYYSCPISDNDINLSKYWFNPTLGTPDYFNACYIGIGGAGVPDNFAGNQHARTGNSYAGFLEFEGIHPEATEYIETQLIDSLLIGRKYCVEFYVSLAEISMYGIDALGAYFSKDSVINYNTFNILPLFPQIKNPESNIIINTTNWVLISGSIIANGGERFLTIGNFKNYSNIHKDSIGNSNQYSYYFIDDVSVMQIPEIDAGRDTVINEGESVQLHTTTDATWTINYNWQPTMGLNCTDCANPIANPMETNVYKVTVSDSLGCPNEDSIKITVIKKMLEIPNIITPNGDGVNDRFEIKNLPTVAEVLIFNRWGEMVFHGGNGWDAKEVSGGVYYFVLSLPGGERKKGFVEVIK